MQSKPSRRSQRCLPLPGHKHFSFRQHESLCCKGNSQTPAFDRATAWHLNSHVEKHLTNCLAVSRHLPFCLLSSFLFSSLQFLPYPTYSQYRPMDLQEAPALGEKAAPAAPHTPCFVVGDPCLAQIPHASFAPKPVSWAIPFPLLFHLHVHPSRSWQKPGWPLISATWSFSMASQDTGLLFFWKGHFSSSLIHAYNRNLEAGTVVISPIFHQHNTFFLFKVCLTQRQTKSFVV